MVPNQQGLLARPAARPSGRGRADDRRVVAASLVVAGAFVLAAGMAIGVGAMGVAVAAWLPLHLLLAGAASTAIVGVMPFFVGALAAAPPAGLRLRSASVALVALGAAGVAGRSIVPGAGWLPVVGGSLYLAGIACAAAATRQAGRRGLMARRPIVTLAYALALLNVGVGASLGTLLVAGWTPIVERWGLLRPAHAWTNLVGFVSLVVVGTLLHFLPTILGTRIVSRRSGTLAVLGLGLGAPVVVAGFTLGVDVVVRLGAIVSGVGVAGVVAEAVTDLRSRGRWTGDRGWHLVAGGMLLAGCAWFAVGAGLAVLRVLALGADGAAWSSSLVAAPLVGGWVVQVLIGSATHLLPAIAPGGPREHAVRRGILGRWALPRFIALNAGVLLLATGWWGGVEAAAWLGLAIAGGGILASVVLAARALRATAPA